MSEIQIEETETEAELEVKEEARTVYADKLDLDVATICNRIQQNPNARLVHRYCNRARGGAHNQRKNFAPNDT
jgi:hypothetical protein